MVNRVNKGNWDATVHYQDTKVAQDYDRVRFSSVAGKVFNRQEQRIILDSFADLPPETTILDLPCGTGRLARALLEAGYTVVGADISAEMLEVANERLQQYQARFSTQVMDAFSLTGQEQQYQATLCARVLMHFPLETQIEFMQGVARISSKRVVINHSLNSPYQRLRRRIKKLLGHQESAAYPITNDEIKRLLAESGFAEVRRTRINRLISEAVYIVAEKIS